MVHVNQTKNLDEEISAVGRRTNNGSSYKLADESINDPVNEEDEVEQCTSVETDINYLDGNLKEQNEKGPKLYPVEGTGNDDGDEIIYMPKKIKHILDSDDDDDGNALSAEEKGQESLHNINSIDTEKQGGQKKISAIIDSDSDENITGLKYFEGASKNKTKLFSLIDSGSEEEKDNEDTKDAKLLKKNHKRKPIKHEQKTLKISSLIDSDSEEELGGDDKRECFEEIKDIEQESHLEEETKIKKPIRASAKKAINEMQAIQSEQQRLHREAYISIPYHKPKRHTLEEFLKRRTIQMSHQKKSASIINPIKMTTEELEEYAKLMEEREKEAAVFFKSESEDEDDFKDNDVEKIASEENNEIILSSPMKNDEDREADSERSQNKLATENGSTENISNEEGNLVEVPADLEKKNSEGIFTSQPIVTEVVELPKLNLDELKIAPPTAVEKVFRLIQEKQLPVSPSLKGEANTLIDLETGDVVVKKPSGVDDLLKRFMKTKIQKRSKPTNSVSVLSADNGKLEFSTINVNLTEEESISEKEAKPRAAYFKLKENLREIINKKRREEFEKKKNENEENKLEDVKDLSDDEDNEDVDDDEMEQFEELENNYLVDEEENPIDLIENHTKETNFTSDDIILEGLLHSNEEKLENNDNGGDHSYKESKECNNLIENNNDDEDSDVDEDNDDEDDLDDDANDDELKTCIQDDDCSKKRNRIIKMFEEDSDEETENNFCGSSSLQRDSIFEICDKEPRNPIEGETELLQLCSGKFNETQQKTSENAFISQIPITQTNVFAHQTELNDELLGLCSGTFGTQENVTSEKESSAPLVSPTFTKKILSSDEETSNKMKNSNRIKKLTKRMKKRNKIKLGFSDDEGDGEETLSSCDDNQLSAIYNNGEDVPETLVDYDSEENEIIVKMTKDECAKRAGEYFDKEAELSETDWGSADEDERNLDKYDIELGDEEEFDREKLQTELGQIHARKMLDDDLREVRKIQEMFFEDEENDGVGRQRQFRWKNIESGFNLNETNVEPENGEKAESEEEENEHLWRTTRFEREQILKEKNIETDISLISQTETSSLTINTSKKVNVITSKATISTEDKKSSPFLIMKSIAAKDRKPFRGSFLSRDNETLNKLAGFTKGTVSDNGLGGGGGEETNAGTVTVKQIKPKNFVFATLTAEEHENLKRKSNDLNSSSENGVNYMKKPRIEHRRNKCLIDQLL